MNDNDANEDIELTNYNMYRDDRKYNHAGGVALYIHERFISRPTLTIQSEKFENLCRDLITSEGKIRVCVIYRPGSTPVSWFDDLQILFDQICDCNYPLYLTGDTNVDLLPTSTDPYKQRLLRLAESYGFRQVIDKPTRITLNSKTLIDLLFIRRYSITN